VRSYQVQKSLPSVRFVGLLLIVIGLLAVVGVAENADEEVLEEIRAEIIPVEGAETEYGIPLSLTSLPQFVEWWYTLVPIVETDARYFDALSVLVAPCCDDNPAFKCCCESDEGQACNIIRSGKGLSDYYLAAELQSRNIDPGLYGLTTEGSCYRSMCDTPISEGGCGGMKELIEPAIETIES